MEKDEFNTKKLRDTRTQEFGEINRKQLSTSNNPEFRKPCTHGRSDGKVNLFEEEWTAAGNIGKPKMDFGMGFVSSVMAKEDICFAIAL